MEDCNANAVAVELFTMESSHMKQKIHCTHAHVL